ncbi:MAG: hypothetical protein ACREU7_16490 [Burkholderiales bacterium]
MSAGQLRIADSLFGIGGASRVVQMPRHVGHMRLEIAGVDSLNRLNDPQVQPLPARRGNRAQQRLPDQLVGEGEAGLGPVRLGGDQLSAFRLVDGV